MAGTFPLLNRQDSQYYGIMPENPGMRSEMDGGYVMSRARHSRPPRKTYTTGFTDLSNAERISIQDFWDLNMGSADSFSWTDPVDAGVKTVRFAGDLDFKYTGVGGNHRWMISNIKLEEV